MNRSQEEGVFSPLFAASNKMLSFSVLRRGSFRPYALLNEGHKEAGRLKNWRTNARSDEPRRSVTPFPRHKGARVGAEQEV